MRRPRFIRSLVTGCRLHGMHNSTGPMAVILLVSTVLGLQVARTEADPPPRPNVLFILADDKYVSTDSKPRQCPGNSDSHGAQT